MAIVTHFGTQVHTSDMPFVAAMGFSVRVYFSSLSLVECFGNTSISWTKETHESAFYPPPFFSLRVWIELMWESITSKIVDLTEEEKTDGYSTVRDIETVCKIPPSPPPTSTSEPVSQKINNCVDGCINKFKMVMDEKIHFDKASFPSLFSSFVLVLVLFLLLLAPISLRRPFPFSS